VCVVGFVGPMVVTPVARIQPRARTESGPAAAYMIGMITALGT
jgi:hypothetical protein